MAPDTVTQLIARLFLAGPILYIGLVMSLDPDGFVRLLRVASGAMETLQERFRSYRTFLPPPIPVTGQISARASRWVRFCGVVLSVVAFLSIAIPVS